MKEVIRGTTLPIVDVELREGESVFTEAGGMAWMSSNIEMDSKMDGGIGRSIGRLFSGESLFLVHFTCTKGTGLVSFASEFPGNVVKFPLKENQSVICQRDAFMLAHATVDLKMEFNKRLGAGFFGGEGFFLQKITGPGTAYLEFTGEMTEYTLKAGQTLRVDPGYIGAFEPTVQYDISRVKGVKNWFFSGEGLFLAQLTGPGKVWLQSMPLRNLAKRLAPYLPKRQSGGVHINANNLRGFGR